jgi:hypothetical protein
VRRCDAEIHQVAPPMAQAPAAAHFRKTLRLSCIILKLTAELLLSSQLGNLQLSTLSLDFFR